MNLVHRCRGLSRCFVWVGSRHFWLAGVGCSLQLLLLFRRGNLETFGRNETTSAHSPTPLPTFSHVRVSVAKWSNKNRDILSSESGIAPESSQRPTNYVLHHGAATHCRLCAQIYCHCIARTDGMCVYAREHVSNASRDGVSGSREPST